MTVSRVEAIDAGEAARCGWRRVLCAAAGLSLAASAVAAKPPRKWASPFVRVLDTGAPAAAPLSAVALDEEKGWRAVPAGKPTRRVAGDLVVRNDKLALVFRRRGRGVEVYARAAKGFRLRATLVAVGAASPGRAPETNALRAVKIAENRRAAVTVEAGFARAEVSGPLSRSTEEAPAPSVGVRFRLTTGSVCVQARAGEGAARLRVETAAAYVVAPDFFGDDVILPVSAGSKRPRVALLAENWLLNLVGGGEAIVACVWPAVDQNADAVFASQGGARRFGGCEIDFGRAGKVWTAFLEGAGLWHAATVPQSKRGADVALEWTPPFAAKWRCALERDDTVSSSWTFREGRLAEYDCPWLGRIVYPCWFAGKRAFVRLPPAGRNRRNTGLALVYPLDRTGRTPIAQFCLIDVYRNALGAGPCPYILAAEGLDADAQATPDNVTAWLAEQLKRAKSRRPTEDIRERLAQLVRHVSAVNERIDEYAAFAQRVRQHCTGAAKGGAAETAAELRGVADRLIDAYARGRRAMARRRSMEKLVRAASALVEREDAAAAFDPLGAEFRRSGAVQDKTLARCRLGARRLRHACRDIRRSSDDPAAAKLAEQVRAEVDRILRAKAAPQSN